MSDKSVSLDTEEADFAEGMGMSAEKRQFAKRFASHRHMVEDAAGTIDMEEGRQNLANLARFHQLMERGHRQVMEEMDGEE